MPRFNSIPAQLTTDASVLPTEAALNSMAKIASEIVRVATEFAKQDAIARGEPESEDYALLAEIKDRKELIEPEQARMRVLFRRMDNLYYPEAVTTGGADHWPEGEKPGRVHISLNNAHVFVDIPASLQAVPPIENVVPAVVESDEQAERDAAARVERLYFEWKDEEEFELKVHRACVSKGLYGLTYGKVYWDDENKRPTVSIIERPDNLYIGWGASDFSRMDWAIYCYGLSPQAVEEDFDLIVEPRKYGDKFYPYVTTRGDAHADPIGNVHPAFDPQDTRTRTEYEENQVEVYDYWYKKPTKRGVQIWNAIYVGNALIKNERHPEYDDIPYLPLNNTFIPGLPFGRSELYDLEQLIHEKDERLTNAAEMIRSITDGQRWQLVGPEAPEDVPANAIPQPNKVAAPGPNAEIKAIQPFVAEYAVEDFLKRLDQEAETLTGLNELLMGRAPATILGSSKAIAALVANYEARIYMKRQLLYQWRKRVWRFAAKVWERKDRRVRDIIDGRYRLDVSPPELTPRDELENANKAMSLVQNRIWSGRRAMDATGVEDPEAEIAIIREEQTDAAMNPAAVQAQVTLLSGLAALGIQPPQGAQAQAENAARTLTGSVPGGQSLNAPENQGNPPGEALPENARAANGAPAQQGGAVAQTLLQGGEASGRVLTNTPLGGA